MLKVGLHSLQRYDSLGSCRDQMKMRKESQRWSKVKKRFHCDGFYKKG